jgi:hypothetical protein
MSSLQSQNKGYLAALIGGFGGAIAFLATLFIVAKEYITQFQNQPNASVGLPFIIGIMLGTTCAEVLGCWLAL